MKKKIKAVKAWAVLRPGSYIKPHEIRLHRAAAETDFQQAGEFVAPVIPVLITPITPKPKKNTRK